MRLGHVFLDGGEAPLVKAAGVACDAAVLAEDLDDGRGDAHVHFLLDQLVGHAVAVALDLDVVVDVDGQSFSIRRTR